MSIGLLKYICRRKGDGENAITYGLIAPANKRNSFTNNILRALMLHQREGLYVKYFQNQPCSAIYLTNEASSLQQHYMAY